MRSIMLLLTGNLLLLLIGCNNPPKELDNYDNTDNTTIPGAPPEAPSNRDTTNTLPATPGNNQGVQIGDMQDTTRNPNRDIAP